MKFFSLVGYLINFGCGWLNVTIIILFSPFVATHHTGNITKLPLYLLTGQYAFLFCTIGIVISFIIGSAVSGVIPIGKRTNPLAAFAPFHIIGAIILFVVAIFFRDLFVMTLYCAFYSGFQNGFISQMGLKASHMSGLVSDAGVSLGRAIRELKKEKSSRTSKYRTDVILKFGSVICFASGAFLGALLSLNLNTLLVYLFIAIYNIIVPIYYMSKKKIEFETP